MKLINRSPGDIMIVILSIAFACTIWAWVKRDMMCNDISIPSHSKKALQCTSSIDNKNRR